jgi:endonuclease G
MKRARRILAFALVVVVRLFIGGFPPGLSMLYGSEDVEEMVYGGIPTGNADLKLLQNKAFLVGYDEQRKDPAWVAYRVGGPPKFTDHKRLSYFTIDKRTTARVRDGDYTNVGFARGHMAASYAVYSRYGKDAQRETYVMSNVCPQYSGLNSGRWEDVECLVARKTPAGPSWAEKYEEIWVIAGPIFDSQKTFISSGIEIPDAFYTIVLDIEEQTGEPRALAFIMPNKSNVKKALTAYLVTIDKIEKKTGLDFFHKLEDELERQLESKKATSLWP